MAVNKEATIVTYISSKKEDIIVPTLINDNRYSFDVLPFYMEWKGRKAEINRIEIKNEEYRYDNNYRGAVKDKKNVEKYREYAPDITQTDTWSSGQMSIFFNEEVAKGEINGSTLIIEGSHYASMWRGFCFEPFELVGIDEDWNKGGDNKLILEIKERGITNNSSSVFSPTITHFMINFGSTGAGMHEYATKLKVGKKYHFNGDRLENAKILAGNRLDMNNSADQVPEIRVFNEEGEIITHLPFPHNDNSEPKDNNNNKIVGICNKCGADYRNIESWYYSLNESGKSSWEKLSWFCGKCWQQEEKNWRQKSSPKNTAYKSEPQKYNLGDEHYYYFENGQWISLESGTPDPNTTNSEGKVSRLVTLVNHIQPPSEGKDKGNWDYFWYVLTAENGERFEINALNPAIGFEAKDKNKEFFPRAGNNGVRFWYKISWNSTEPDKRKFGKEDFIEIEKWNTGDKPLSREGVVKILEKEWESEKNKTSEELSISIIREFFREWNVKAIEITSSGDLFVEYNNGSSETIKNDEKGTGIIKNNLDKVLNKRKLDQQELEKLQTDFSSHQPVSPVNSPKSDYVPYLVGGIVAVILLGGGLIFYRLKPKRKK